MGVDSVLVLVHGVIRDVALIGNTLKEHFSVDIASSCFGDLESLKNDGKAFDNAYCLLSSALTIDQCRALRLRLKAEGIALFDMESTDVESVEQQLAALRRNCILSGFLPIEENDMSAILKMKVPGWEIGAKTALKQPATTWTLNPDDDEEEEVLDDEEFLTEEDLKPALVVAGGKQPVKKACENCTCGRAEGKEQVKLTQAMLDNPVTSCGSCGLGDAYRCASCPYRGLPTFEPGKKIELPEGFLLSDV